MMFYQSYSNILIKLRQPAIYEPDDIGKSYVPQKKALNSFLDIYSAFWIRTDFLVVYEVK